MKLLSNDINAEWADLALFSPDNLKVALLDQDFEKSYSEQMSLYVYDIESLTQAGE